MPDWERLTPGAGYHSNVLLSKPYGDGSGIILRSGFEDEDGRLASYKTQGIGASNAELDRLATKSQAVQRLAHIVRVFSEIYSCEEGCFCALCEAHRETEDVLALFEEAP
jgi:hypothetical protein